MKEIPSTTPDGVTPKMNVPAAADTIKKDVIAASDGAGPPSSTSPTIAAKTETSTSPTPAGVELGKNAETSQSGAEDYLTKIIGIKQNADGTYTDTSTQKTLSEIEVKNRISSTGQNPDKVLETLKGGQPKGTMDASGPAPSSGVGGAPAIVTCQSSPLTLRINPNFSNQPVGLSLGPARTFNHSGSLILTSIPKPLI